MPSSPAEQPQRTSATGPHRRSSKACETCRVRRIKCSGPPPCQGCIAAGLGSSCAVRLKARPKRAPSAKLFARLSNNGGTGAAPSVDAGPSGSAPTLPPSMSHMRDEGTRTVYRKRNPLDEVEGALAIWCANKGVPFSQLVFKVDTRLAGLPSTALPPPNLLRDYEDGLIETFFNSPEYLDRHTDHRETIRSLFARYRAVPGSLTEDQRALVYAILCMARYLQIKSNINAGTPHATTEATREDVTYYHMGYDALATWARPSLTAIWALFYLVPYTLGMGGWAETKDLLQQWAWQIKELGLHRQDTASLYAPHEVGQLFFAYFYTDILRASMTDLRPLLPLTEIDVDPTPSDKEWASFQSRVSDFNTRFLADFNDPTVDTGAMDYAAAAESTWFGYVRELRHSMPADVPRAKISWAQFRYNWLRILLYIPLINNPPYQPVAFGMITRAVSQIFQSYSDLVAIGNLNPSWPQLQRLVVCGQLLILCHEAGELHRREATLLFQMLLEFLEKHLDTWPTCAELILGYQAVAKAFDIHLTPDFELPTLGDDPVFALHEVHQWPLIPYGLDLDFDLTLFP